MLQRSRVTRGPGLLTFNDKECCGTFQTEKTVLQQGSNAYHTMSAPTPNNFCLSACTIVEDAGHLTRNGLIEDDKVSKAAGLTQMEVLPNDLAKYDSLLLKL
jgi:hypothetical protein